MLMFRSSALQNDGSLWLGTGLAISNSNMRLGQLKRWQWALYTRQTIHGWHSNSEQECQLGCFQCGHYILSHTQYSICRALDTVIRNATGTKQLDDLNQYVKVVGQTLLHGMPTLFCEPFPQGSGNAFFSFRYQKHVALTLHLRTTENWWL